MLKSLAKRLVHLVTGLGGYHKKRIQALAKRTRGKRILELGSGGQSGGRYPRSTGEWFEETNDFVRSDIDPSFGLPLIDVTTMTFEDEFDIILCLNVLEHVFEFHRAIERMSHALKPGGLLVVLVPAFYPLHDEPGDYWRFTEHSLRRLFGGFDDLVVAHCGLRVYPFGYYVEGIKPRTDVPPAEPESAPQRPDLCGDRDAPGQSREKDGDG